VKGLALNLKTRLESMISVIRKGLAEIGYNITKHLGLTGAWKPQDRGAVPPSPPPPKGFTPMEEAHGEYA